MSQIEGTAGKQCSFIKILGLWALVTLPMIAMTWVVAPSLIPRIPILPAVAVYVLLMIPGIVWQLVLSLWIIRGEEGNLQWGTIHRRIWLNPPVHPETGQPDRRLYMRLLPRLIVASLALILGAMLFSYFGLRLRVAHYWPGLAIHTNMLEFAGPIFAGQWWALGLAVVVLTLNGLFAEELFFRGVLLPKMNIAFGKHDWLVNAVLYSLYYLHKPWIIPFRFINALAITWPARRFHSNWMAIAARGVEGVGLVAIVLYGILSPALEAFPTSLTLPHISKQPAAKNLAAQKEAITELPVYDPNLNTFRQVDLRSSDISTLDLRTASKDLFYADFDSLTIWSSAEQMPGDFDPQRIMEMGKNPGLGLRQLHAQGITGEGVNIAIIDSSILTGHQEYTDQLKWYDEFGQDVGDAQYHGMAVASIAVGNTVGVAPKAGLYFIGRGNPIKAMFFHSQYFAVGIRRILEINRQLPEGQKIRAISISSSWRSTDFDIQAVVKEAKDAGMLVLTSLPELVHEGFELGIVGREPLANPDIFESYGPGLFFEATYYAYHEWNQSTDILWAPVDARTYASHTGVENYTYDPKGGFSWSMPYIVGVYALAAQVEPDITPDHFWSLALETGRTVEIEHEGQTYSLGPIIDPPALIAALQTGQ